MQAFICHSAMPHLLPPCACVAEQVLQQLWQAQPDAAAQQPMPYTQNVLALLADDPYFRLSMSEVGSKRRYWVQLRVDRIKELLCF